jgi:hypothetical protein
MNTHERNDEASTTMTELSAVSTGTMIRLDDETITLDRVEHLGATEGALSPVHGMPLTKIKFRRNGRTKRRIYPSMMLVERLRRGRNRP